MITLNGQDSNSNLLLLNGVQNIVEVEQSLYSSTPAYGTITVGTVTPESGKYISVNGNMITSVISNPEGRSFLLNSDATSTAWSVINALKNISEINGNYELYLDPNNAGKVYIRARQGGHKYDLSISTDITGIAMNTHASDDQGWNLDEIMVDVFENSKFNATLQKTVAESKTSFDISPVLTPEYGAIDTCMAKLRGINPANLVATLDTFNFKCIKGYAVNNSPLYLQAVNQMACYLQRGKILKSGADNRTSIFLNSDNKLIFSYLNLTSVTLEFEMRYLTSALDTVATDTLTLSGQTVGVIDIEYDMSNYMGNDIYYLDVEMPDGYVCRYDIIRPARASEDINRIIWRNEFGGLSFADMSSSTTEKLDLERSEIRKHLYDTYNSDIDGNRLSWSAKENIKLTLHTHLMPKEGTYLFNSLGKSKLIWLEREGVKRYVTLDDIKIMEQDVNDVFEVQVDITY